MAEGGAAAIVKGLFIYPVKGLQGTSLSSATVEPEGLQYDRRWMIVGEDGVFRSQRQIPVMATIRPEIFGERMALTDGNEDSIEFSAAPVTDGSILPVMIWNSSVNAYPVSSMADRWLSDRLGEPVRLVTMGPVSHRPLSPDHSLPDDRTGFADGFPVLLANEESLADLNGRLEVAVPMDRFRANIVISGMEPWAEDDLDQFSVGEVRFQAAKLCARCQVPTIDQSTGERKGPEPITTLAKFRLIDGKVMFGMNLIPRSAGIVRVGDSITLLEA